MRSSHFAGIPTLVEWKPRGTHMSSSIFREERLRMKQQKEKREARDEERFPVTSS